MFGKISKNDTSSEETRVFQVPLLCAIAKSSECIRSLATDKILKNILMIFRDVTTLTKNLLCCKV